MSYCLQFVFNYLLQPRCDCDYEYYPRLHAVKNLLMGLSFLELQYCFLSRNEQSDSLRYFDLEIQEAPKMKDYAFYETFFSVGAHLYGKLSWAVMNTSWSLLFWQAFVALQLAGKLWTYLEHNRNPAFSLPLSISQSCAWKALFSAWVGYGFQVPSLTLNIYSALRPLHLNANDYHF